MTKQKTAAIAAVDQEKDNRAPVRTAHSPKSLEIERLMLEVRETYHDSVDFLRKLDVFVTEGAGSFRILAAINVTGPMTVPQIKDRLECSRQYAHRKTNALLEAGFLVSIQNPAHRSSNLMDITDKGRAEYRNRRARYMKVFTGMQDDFSAEELANVIGVLRKFRARIAKK